MALENYGNYPDLSSVKRILVIRMRHHGDVLLTSSLFTNLKKALPEANIDAFIYEDTAPMLEGHPALSELILYNRGWKKLSVFKKIRKEISLLRAIRAKGYDMVINLTEGDRGALAAWIARARIRVGFDPQGKGFWGKRDLYTHVVKICPHPRHTVERQLDALRRIGIFPSPEERSISLHLPQGAHTAVLNLLAHEEISSGQYTVIHPVSRWRFKCLSTQQMAEVVRLFTLRNEPIVMTAGPDPIELTMVYEILKQVPEARVLNLAGKLTLKELGALIAQARGLICVDSVPLHIASAVKTPVVALFGPTSELNWGPWMHPRSVVLTHPTPCRPCYQDGCGGSKKSDCLLSLQPQKIVEAWEGVTGGVPVSRFVLV